jgi:hypothetical protein
MSKHCCSECAHAVRPVGRWFRLILSRWPGLLTCLNHPDTPGRLTGVPHTGTCANFRPRHKRPVRSAPRESSDDKIRYIPLTQGMYAIVDAEDYERVSRYKWYAVRDGRTYYARRTAKIGHITLHRQIMRTPKGKVTDHIDGNGLNDRRSNLRNCNPTENSRNRRRNRKTITGFKGVWREKKTGKYCAQIHFDHKYVYLGTFATPEEAAHAYDRKARQLFGPFARCNFPEEE